MGCCCQDSCDGVGDVTMQVVDEFRDMVPMMKKGDVKGVFNAIIGNPSLLNAINVRAPHPFCRAGNTKVF